MLDILRRLLLNIHHQNHFRFLFLCFLSETSPKARVLLWHMSYLISSSVVSILSKVAL